MKLNVTGLNVEHRIDLFDSYCNTNFKLSEFRNFIGTENGITYNSIFDPRDNSSFQPCQMKLMVDVLVS